MDIYNAEGDPSYLNLQTELIWLQQSLIAEGRRLLIIFEGRDTAGKGGAIMRFVRYLNPKHYRIVALSKPTGIESGQWYFQRYIKHLPDPGCITLFDRSWYNRAVVEPVMGFCSEDQYSMFIDQAVQLEDMLVNDGLPIIKFWFSIDVSEQKKRLQERETNPLKQWKLSSNDMKAQEKWNEFTRYKEAMFAGTSTEQAPWIVIDGNDRDAGRMEAMRYVLDSSDYERKGETGERLCPDDSIVKPCAHIDKTTG